MMTKKMKMTKPSKNELSGAGDIARINVGVVSHYSKTAGNILEYGNNARNIYNGYNDQKNKKEDQ